MFRKQYYNLVSLQHDLSKCPKFFKQQSKNVSIHGKGKAKTASKIVCMPMLDPDH